MSNDAKVTKDLMMTLKDGTDGFAKGAEKLVETNHPELATTFRKYADQRAAYYAELEKLAAQYGDDIEPSGSVVGTIHRGWMAVKDALSGSSAEGVLDAAEQGEDHAKSSYEDALKEDVSAELAAVIRRQYEGVCAGHDEVRSLRESLAA